MKGTSINFIKTLNKVIVKSYLFYFESYTLATYEKTADLLISDIVFK